MIDLLLILKISLVDFNNTHIATIWQNQTITLCPYFLPCQLFIIIIKTKSSFTTHQALNKRKTEDVRCPQTTSIEYLLRARLMLISTYHTPSHALLHDLAQ